MPVDDNGSSSSPAPIFTPSAEPEPEVKRALPVPAATPKKAATPTPAPKKATPTPTPVAKKATPTPAPPVKKSASAATPEPTPKEAAVEPKPAEKPEEPKPTPAKKAIAKESPPKKGAPATPEPAPKTAATEEPKPAEEPAPPKATPAPKKTLAKEPSTKKAAHSTPEPAPKTVAAEAPKPAENPIEKTAPPAAAPAPKKSVAKESAAKKEKTAAPTPEPAPKATVSAAPKPPEAPAEPPAKTAATLPELPPPATSPLPEPPPAAPPTVPPVAGTPPATLPPATDLPPATTEPPVGPLPATPNAVSEVPPATPNQGQPEIPSQLFPSGISQLPAVSIPAAPAPSGETTPPPPPDITKFSYPVTQFHVTYGPTMAGLLHSLPPIDEITNFTVELGEMKEGYTAPDRPGAHKVTIHPMTKGRRVYFGDALLAMNNRLVQQLNKRGLYGVYVVPSASEIDITTGEDKRKDKTSLDLQIYLSVVKEVRTISRRVPFRATDVPVIDGIAHARIRKDSPIIPSSDMRTDASLLRQAPLQDYLTRINRFPGRRVDASVNASDQPGQITLDYLVREQKPWTAFVQTSNTGTESTGEWRERIGFEERQLFRLDDTLRMDYTTSDLNGYQSASFSYDFTPIFPDYLKVRTYFNWGRYSAADIGVQFSQFDGQTFTTGSSITWTPFYVRNFPIDITGGVEWQNIATSNETFFGGGLPSVGEAGGTNFLLPFLGVATERNTDKYTFAANLEFQTNLSGLINTDQGVNLAALGRPDVSRNFTIGKFNFLYSLYLEPLIFGKAWDDQKVWWKSTRAHELYVSFRGQNTFDEGRLVPQLQFVEGGFNTVRGYPESFVVGDSGFASTVEYRFHLPRAFRPEDQRPPEPKHDPAKLIGPPKPVADPNAPPPPEEPAPAEPEKKKFVLFPEHIGSSPDWDLIFRTFFDAGQVFDHRVTSLSEQDRTLLSVGAGLELQVMKPVFMSFRADWAFALRSETEALDQTVKAGDSRVHLSVSFSF